MAMRARQAVVLHVQWPFDSHSRGAAGIKWEENALRQCDDGVGLVVLCCVSHQ